jgi:hypothetical protein
MLELGDDGVIDAEQGTEALFIFTGGDGGVHGSCYRGYEDYDAT